MHHWICGNVFLNVSAKRSRGSVGGRSLIAALLRLLLKYKCIRCKNACLGPSAHVTASSKSQDAVLQQERGAAIGFCVCLLVCVGMREWLGLSQRSYPFFLLSPLKKKKVESASPSLWKFPTTPSWRIMTKRSNSCWKHTTRGQSSSSPMRKTYGEERRWWRATFGFLITEQRLLEPCLRHRHAMHARQTHLWQKQI